MARHLTRPTLAHRDAIYPRRGRREREAKRTLRYVEPLSDARTKLSDVFSNLLEGWFLFSHLRKIAQLFASKRNS
jgi:hypothetical protein